MVKIYSLPCKGRIFFIIFANIKLQFMEIRYKHIILLLMALMSFNNISAKIRPIRLCCTVFIIMLLTIDTSILKNSSTYSYQRSLLKVDRRNFTFASRPVNVCCST